MACSRSPWRTATPKSRWRLRSGWRPRHPGDDDKQADCHEDYQDPLASKETKGLPPRSHWSLRVPLPCASPCHPSLRLASGTIPLPSSPEEPTGTHTHTLPLPFSLPPSLALLCSLCLARGMYGHHPLALLP